MWIPVPSMYQTPTVLGFFHRQSCNVTKKCGVIIQNHRCALMVDTEDEDDQRQTETRFICAGS